MPNKTVKTNWTSRIRCICALLLLCGGATQAQQTVFLDFDSGNDGSINYTPSMRDAVQGKLEDKYAPWNILFTQSPTPGAARLTFNEGFPGGVAQHIDFRNLILNDSAVINISGLGVSGTTNIIEASATVGAHELGHLLGLRHGDSFGPIGEGIGSTGPGSGSYLPRFPGPNGGVEVNDHVMGTPAIGASNLTRDTWLSERSAIKMQFAVDGVVIPEAPGSKSTLASAQPIDLSNMTVPNTIRSGQFAGIGDFSVDAVSVTGALSSAGQEDFYRIEANAGDLFNIEVMSSAISHRLGNTIDSQISILDSSGSLIPYWGNTSTGAFNDDEFETLDSILIDVTMPATDTYYVKVNPWSASDSGSYELFVYRFNGAAPSIDGDFNNDGSYDCVDVDALVAAIVDNAHDPLFDLTADGLVDQTDLGNWLAEAGANNLPSGNPYLRGDANLDGFVDLSDFNEWNESKFTAIPAWCSGDFNADGVADVEDFNIWNQNKFQSSANVVPEPATVSCLLLGFLASVALRRRGSLACGSLA